MSFQTQKLLSKVNVLPVTSSWKKLKSCYQRSTFCQSPVLGRNSKVVIKGQRSASHQFLEETQKLLSKVNVLPVTSSWKKLKSCYQRSTFCQSPVLGRNSKVVIKGQRSASHQFLEETQKLLSKVNVLPVTSSWKKLKSCYQRSTFCQSPVLGRNSKVVIKGQRSASHQFLEETQKLLSKVNVLPVTSSWKKLKKLLSKVNVLPVTSSWKKLKSCYQRSTFCQSPVLGRNSKVVIKGQRSASHQFLEETQKLLSKVNVLPVTSSWKKLKSCYQRSTFCQSPVLGRNSKVVIKGQRSASHQFLEETQKSKVVMFRNVVFITWSLVPTRQNFRILDKHPINSQVNE
ncbi:hypothetical protein RRG08_055467 [Elysia crispata]|uniref:Uncharacterized protein n=1 Tax=Elysia crispata TaxID=231223 RepID=A0AAE0YQZ6_9GAST|nr:hypothetical protein RRG08_055467 [Elysia crispata]